MNRQFGWMAGLLLVACQTQTPPSDVISEPTVSCADLCMSKATECASIDAVECTSSCEAGRVPADGGVVRDVRSCLASSTTCSGASACVRSSPSVPFATGPYGTAVRDVAGPFTVPTQSGDWSFQDEWTGNDSYVFLVYGPGLARATATADYSTSLFEGSIAELLAASPRNAHYFVLWQRDEPGFQRLRDSFPAELQVLPEADRAWWASHVHFVSTRADMLPNWIGTLMRARLGPSLPYERYDALQFAIDRSQRIREVGQLGRLASGGLAPELRMAANEVTYYNFEADRAKRLAQYPATVVNIASQRVVHDTFEEDVELPSAQMLATFDTLEVDLSMECPNHRDGECGAWDYLSHLWVCTAASSTSGDAGVEAGADGGGPAWECNREVARWITTYWREGRWVTDISGMLPLLRAGGRTHFRWWASGQWDPRSTDYTVSLSLRFSQRARATRPVDVVPLWSGGDWNAQYDSQHAPMRVTVPADVRKVELYTLLTGHGGVQPSNCAEFCNHEHHFGVNGQRTTIRFPESRTADGCTNRVNEGVVPNQHGTWYFGRGGWCPGLDVAPHVTDVTSMVRLGMENEFTYTTSFAGQPVGANLGNIVLTSYLVYSR